MYMNVIHICITDCFQRILTFFDWFRCTAPIVSESPMDGGDNDNGIRTLRTATAHETKRSQKIHLRIFWRRFSWEWTNYRQQNDVALVVWARMYDAVTLTHAPISLIPYLASAEIHNTNLVFFHFCFCFLASMGFDVSIFRADIVRAVRSHLCTFVRYSRRRDPKHLVFVLFFCRCRSNGN